MIVKKKRIILPIAAACALVAVVLTFRISFSYLMDAERKDNVITIGNVDVELSEPSYTDSSIVAAGDAPPKNPLLINKGTEDEYVFLRIAVPKKNVTLLYESDIKENETTTYPKGTPTVKNRDASGKPQASKDEIFRFIAEGDLTSKVTETAEPKTTEPQFDFAYNAGHKSTGDGDKQDTEGWVYLYRKIDAENDYNYYYFGYNKVLKYDSNQKKPSETKTLFDRVQLKSFIDEELVSKPDGESSKIDFPPSLIKVKGYGVQSDSLEIEDLPGRNEILTKEKLEEIFGIVSRKAGET